jgi:hypothetical protein
MFAELDYRWRRRILVTTVISLLLIALTAFLIIRSVLLFYSDDTARVFELSRNFAGDPVAAFGVNLETVSSGNIIRYGGFEPEVLQNQFTVTAGTENSFVIPSVAIGDSVRSSKDYYEGADIRIYSQSQDRFELRHEARITNFSAGQLLNFRQILLPAEMPNDVVLYDVAAYANTIMLVGDQGVILEINRDGETRLNHLGTSSRLTAVAGSAGGWIVVADDGSYYLSSDGRNWQRERLADVSFNDIIPLPADGRTEYLACADGGKLYRIAYSGFEEISLDLHNDLNALAIYGERIVLAASNGLILSGDLNLQFQPVANLTSSHNWLSLAAGTEGFVCCGTQGGMAYSADGLNFELIRPDVLADVYGVNPVSDQSEHESIIWPALVNCTWLTDQAVLFQTASGQSWLSEVPGEPLIVSPYFKDGGSVNFINTLPGGRILSVYENSSLEMANLSDTVTFAPALDKGEVQPGDMILLEKISLPPAFGQAETDSAIVSEPKSQNAMSKDGSEPGIWYVSGGSELTMQQVAANSPQELGRCCVRLSNAGAEDAEDLDSDLLIASSGRAINSLYNRMPVWLDSRLAQKLDLKQSGGLSESFYRLEVYLRQEGLKNNSVVVWLSGLQTDASHTVQKLGNDWERHQFIFVLSRHSADSEVWLNLGFSGKGTLWLDQIWFGSAGDEPVSLPAALIEQLGRIEPEVVRFGFVPIGAPGQGNHSWLLPEGTGSRISAFAAAPAVSDTVADQYQPAQVQEVHNLSAALKLSQQIGADPWLVVDAMATDAELLHLIEFLAGSHSSDYGRLRSKQGAVGRWSDQFNLLYLEICDPTNVFTNDTSRTTYVNHVIDTLLSASDYSHLEHKLIVIDGMDYDGQILASKADYHAGTLTGSNVLDNYGQFTSTWSEFFRGVPTRRVLAGSNAPEMIKSFSWSSYGESLRLADYAALVFGEAGGRINLVLIDGEQMDSEVAARMYTALLQAGKEISNKWALSPPAELLTADRMTADKSEANAEQSATAAAVSDADAGSEAAPEANLDAAREPDAEGKIDPDAEELLLFSFISGEQRTVIMLNLGAQNISLRLGGNAPITQGELYSYDSRATLLAQDQITSANHVYRVLPGGMLVLTETVSAAD